MIIYVMCGIPGSGKTTLSQQLAREYNLTLYSYDGLKNSIHFKQHLFNLIIRSLTNEENVIVDDLYITKDSRSKLISAIPNISCKKVLIVLQTPLDVCIKRDPNRNSHTLGERVVRSFNNKYEQPSLSEGWDEIYYV